MMKTGTHVFVTPISMNGRGFNAVVIGFPTAGRVTVRESNGAIGEEQRCNVSELLSEQK